MLLSSCDVHEFPEESQQNVPFQLYLDFDTELPLYKEIVCSRSGEGDTKGAASNHDVRYIVRAYRSDNARGVSREADSTFVFSKSDIAELNYTAQLELPTGDYEFRVWADYVGVSSREDRYYNTADFSEIIVADKENYSGSNEFRDAFRGYASAAVGEVSEASVEMVRPMGKFKFVSTDVDIFLSRVVQMLAARSSDAESKAAQEQLMRSIDLDEFTVVFRYNAFVPCSFNMFTDKPADAWTGVSFTSRMVAETEGELTLGFDYIFVNGAETTLSVSLEVYNGEGELMSATNPIDVPIVRSKTTVVKGEFLTSKATGGVSINGDYDGDDYNIEII